MKFVSVVALIFGVEAFTIDRVSQPTQPLPKWIDPSRETVQKVTNTIPESFVPPPSNFRVPAEYEPHILSFLGGICGLGFKIF
jgi:hypothetical protein